MVSKMPGISYGEVRARSHTSPLAGSFGIADGYDSSNAFLKLLLVDNLSTVHNRVTTKEK